MGGGLHMGDLLFEEKKETKAASLCMKQVTDIFSISEQILSILEKKKI